MMRYSDSIASSALGQWVFVGRLHCCIIDVVVPARRSVIVAGSSRSSSIGVGRVCCDIVTEDVLDSLVALKGFAHRSSELEGSAGEDLSIGVKVFVVLEEGGKQTI